MIPTDLRWPDLLYVNGPSSAGKTTLCRGLQSAIPVAYLCTGFDDFVFTSAPRYYLGADTLVQTSTDDYTAQGVEMVTTSAPGEPVSITAVFGPVFRRLILSMPAAVRALIDGGNHTIFDDVLQTPRCTQCGAQLQRRRRRRRHGYDGAGPVRCRSHDRAGAPGGVMIGVAPSRVAPCRCALSPAR